MSSADEGAAGISASLGDEGATLQRAQDKIATLQARAGALDELPQSGVLEDVVSDTDDIQQELDEARALQLAPGTLRRLVAENFIRPGRVAVRR
jgi:phage shock protein A